jgi:hypothetical protein
VQTVGVEWRSLEEQLLDPEMQSTGTNKRESESEINKTEKGTESS